MAVSTATTAGQILTSAYVNNNINSGLTYISTVTLSAGAGTAAQWSGTVFSSTYTNYRLVCNLTRTGGGEHSARENGVIPDGDGDHGGL